MTALASIYAQQLHPGELYQLRGEDESVAPNIVALQKLEQQIVQVVTDDILTSQTPCSRLLYYVRVVEWLSKVSGYILNFPSTTEYHIQFFFFFPILFTIVVIHILNSVLHTSQLNNFHALVCVCNALLSAEVQALPWDRIPPKALAALRSLVAILPTTGRYPFSWQ